MVDLRPPHRRARKDDADALTELVNMAGEGLPVYVWTRLAEPGVSAWDIGRERARREEGAFSYRNAVVREEDGQVVACLIGYALASDPEPSDYDGMPPLFVPLQRLEDRVPGTWYVNVLATYPEFRGRGYGSRLLELAEDIAREASCRGLSIIVSDANTGGIRLYERQGYKRVAELPMVKEEWESEGENWVLLVKDL